MLSYLLLVCLQEWPPSAVFSSKTFGILFIYLFLNSSKPAEHKEQIHTLPWAKLKWRNVTVASPSHPVSPIPFLGSLPACVFPLHSERCSLASPHSVSCLTKSSLLQRQDPRSCHSTKHWALPIAGDEFALQRGCRRTRLHLSN